MNKLLNNYAEAIISSGVNIQKNQILIIQAAIEARELVHLCVEKAYKKGARAVKVFYHDDVCDKYHYTYQSSEEIAMILPWQVDSKLDYYKEGACVLHLISDTPGIFKEVDSAKLNAFRMAWAKASIEIRPYTMANKTQWCIAAYPNKEWASLVFPNDLKAEEKLMQSILSSCHIESNNDVVLAWKNHNDAFKKRVDKLNEYAFDYLKFKNRIGTDVTIKLVKNHIWAGGSELSEIGVEFNPNMPTEEIFTMPLKTGVNGKVVASKALDYNGVLIEDFSFEFKDGKVINFDALKGKESLKQLINFDEGSCYLGEVALVPFDSPISKSNILFLNTLFDENASCHLALGDAYPSNLKGGTKMSETELKANGANNSLIHEDFMFGTSDMSIIGVTSKNEEIIIFNNGNFSI